MDAVSDMRIFTAVIDHGGLSAAGRELNLSPAMISKRLARLEDRLGTRLVNRTTRRLSLTDAGEGYYERCVRILEDIDEAESIASSQNLTPRGAMKVSVPAGFGRLHVAPHIPDFLTQYPDVQLHLALSDGIVDIVDDGFDLAVRIAELKDSSLMARRLGPNNRIIVATPEHWKKHGKPKHPRDLEGHNCIAHDNIAAWPFAGPDGEIRFRPTGNFSSNNGDAVTEALLGGLGVSLKATWDVGPLVREGKLEPVLLDYLAPGVEMHAVWPSSRLLSAKVRSFIDFMVERYGRGQPYWDEGLDFLPKPG